MSNLIAFGADQTSESLVTSRYFEKFVIIMHAAFILAGLADVIILHDQDYFNYHTVAISMVFLAALIFITGWRYYIHVKPYDSVITMYIPVYKNAFHTWRQYRKEQHSIEGRHENSTILNGVNISNDLTDEEPEKSKKGMDDHLDFLTLQKL